jgi:hypothetical protein
MRPDPMIDSPLGFPDGPGVVPEAILPEQFFRPSVARSPETQLMLAVLEGALLDLQKSAGARTSRARRLAAEVDAWFAADDEGWPCSFLRICDALGLDASAVRNRVARWRTEASTNVVTLRIERVDAHHPAVDRERRVATAG